MAQNRQPPAFQEYASSMMANFAYRTLSLPGRGLLYTMRLECWVNHCLPAEPEKLAKMLGFTQQEIVATLPAVSPFFANSEAGIICPELVDYRAHLDSIHEKQKAGGIKGAKNKREKGASSLLTLPLKEDPKVFSKAQSRTDQSTPKQLLEKALPYDHQEFVKAMERSESANQHSKYAMESNGG